MKGKGADLDWRAPDAEEPGIRAVSAWDPMGPRTSPNAVPCWSERAGHVVELVTDADGAADERLRPFCARWLRASSSKTLRVADIDVMIVTARTLRDDTAMMAARDAALRVPLVVLVDDDSDEPLAELAGCADVVRAPFEPRELERRLRVLTELRDVRRALGRAGSVLAQVDGLTIADVRANDAPLVHVSSSFEQMTGYSASDCIGKNCRFLQGDETDREAVDALGAALQRGHAARVVLRNYRRDGSSFWNRLTLFPIHDDEGELTHFGGIQSDVTELVEARAQVERSAEALAEREAYMRAILDGLHVSLATTDTAGRLSFINREACATLGLVADDLIGRPAGEVLGLPEGAVALLRDHLGEGLARFEYTYSAPGQPAREIGLSMRRGAGPSDGYGYFLVFRDVAQQRHAERMERLAAVSTMAAGFAHEVRNPLASLRMLSEILVNELPANDSSQEILTRMTRQLARIERLVRTSLRFARPEQPRRGLHEPASLVSALSEALVPRLRKIGVDALDVLTESELPRVDCDDAQLVQVLVILVDNALDSAESVAGVKVRVTQEREHVAGAAELQRRVRIAISDDGPGVPDHLRATIFHPFFTTKPSGTGLGLSIAQQIVHENGGRIELERTAGRGAVFSIVLATEVL